MMAYRSSIHASTQYTPFYLLFGHEVITNRHDVWTTARPPARSIPICKRLAGHWKKSMRMPESTFELPRNFRRNITISELLESKSRLAIECSFMTPQSREQTKKLHSPWQGPYIVETKIGDVIYRIQAEDNPRKRKVAHFNHLKPCGVRKPVGQQR